MSVMDSVRDCLVIAHPPWPLELSHNVRRAGEISKPQFNTSFNTLFPSSGRIISHMGALISRSRRRCLEVPRINGLLVERKIRQSFFVDPILLVVGLAISHVRSESPKELRGH